jgi:hypothetical protein
LQGAVLRLDGVPGPGLDAFGIWAQTGVTDAEAPLVWSASWSSDERADLASLTDADTRLRRASTALEIAAARLDRHLRQPETATVYGVETPAPEAALSALLQAATGAAEPVFALPDSPSLWSRVVTDFTAVLATARRMCAYPAWVETSAAGQLFGRTVVSWTGEQVSVWQASPAHRDVFAHIRVLDLAIRTRAAFLRMVAVVARAAKVLTALATPLGPVLALPAAWKFVDEVVRELSWLRGQT